MKLRPHSVATALANSVFPVPGGPYNNTPVAIMLNYCIYKIEKDIIQKISLELQCFISKSLMMLHTQDKQS